MRSVDAISADMFADRIIALRGASAAVVYGFSAASSPAKVWYDQWRSEVISSYGLALEALGVHPLFLDVTSFCRQALAKELPPLIGAFNLNAGITPIHHWCMVPSVAAWCGVTPYPVHADVLIANERKDLAALVAASVGLISPLQYDRPSLRALAPGTPLILKPRDLGGSVGVRRVSPSEADRKLRAEPTAIVQDFVPGLDITVPVVFHPTTGRHRAPAGILYLPDGAEGIHWMHDRGSKTRTQGYRKQVVPIPAELEARIAAFAAVAELGAFSRVDLRIATTNLHWQGDALWQSQIYFLEVNPLPTLRKGINFLDVVASDVFQAVFTEEAKAMRRVLRIDLTDISMELVMAIAMTGSVR